MISMKKNIALIRITKGNISKNIEGVLSKVKKNGSKIDSWIDRRKEGGIDD